MVHPPLGKWLIALGEQAFGNNELGWRFPAAIAGTLMVLILIRVGLPDVPLDRAGRHGRAADDAGRLPAGAVPHALLDIFLGLFVLAAFAALVLDRDHYRRRWLRALEAGSTRPTARRPRRGSCRGGGWPPACCSGWPAG